MSLGLNRAEMRELMQRAWDNSIVDPKTPGRDKLDAVTESFVGPYRAAIDLMEANNKRLEEQLRALGLLPPEEPKS